MTKEDKVQIAVGTKWLYRVKVGKYDNQKIWQTWEIISVIATTARVAASDVYEMLKTGHLYSSVRDIKKIELRIEKFKCPRDYYQNKGTRPISRWMY